MMDNSNLRLSDLPKLPYQVLARAIRIHQVKDSMIKEMFKLRQFVDYTENELNMEDIHLILGYIETLYPIDEYPEKWI